MTPAGRRLEKGVRMKVRKAGGGQWGAVRRRAAWPLFIANARYNRSWDVQAKALVLPNYGHTHQQLAMPGVRDVEDLLRVVHQE